MWEKARLIAAAIRERIEYMDQVTEQARVFFVDPGYEDPRARDILAQEQVPEDFRALQDKLAALPEALDEETARGLLKKLPKELGLGGKKVYQPLRVALTGKTSGPELHHLLPVLGGQRVIVRLQNALAAAGT